MEVLFGTAADIALWMELVEKVRWNFPGLEREEDIQAHRDTVLKFMAQRRAICAKADGKIVGVLLFSRKHNMLCCMAVDPDYRRRHIATAMFEQMLTIADRSRDITVSTFRAGDPKGDAPRAFYKRHGFVEGELCMEYMCPSQMFLLHPKTDADRGEER